MFPWCRVDLRGLRGALHAGAVDADVAFAVFRQLRVTQDVVSDEELRTVLAAFKRPKDGFVEYKRLLTALINTPVPLLKAELLFKVRERAHCHTRTGFVRVARGYWVSLTL